MSYLALRTGDVFANTVCVIVLPLLMLALLNTGETCFRVIGFACAAVSACHWCLLVADSAAVV